MALIILFSNSNILIQNILGTNIKESMESNGELDTSLAKIIKPENYGNWAEYKIDLNDDNDYTNDWKIFYNDGVNVFLTAADYIPISKIPTTMEKLNAVALMNMDIQILLKNKICLRKLKK